MPKQARQPQQPKPIQRVPRWMFCFALLVLPHAAYAAEQEGRILHEEWQESHPRQQLRQQNSAGAIVQEQVARQSRLAVPVRRLPNGEIEESPVPHENMLESMDVYALSPNAHRLMLPRMVSPELALSLRSHAKSISPALWQGIIDKAASTFGLPAALIAAVIKTESSFVPEATSPAGAQGLMQIMPQTQKELGLTDPYDPESNVLAGTRYLKEQLDRFKTLELALAAYNAGPNAVLKYQGIPPYKETQNYVLRVMAHLAKASP
jgi:soluble lytic murein transglycosylase-like protein